VLVELVEGEALPDAEAGAFATHIRELSKSGTAGAWVF
jgi:hypothetical protein